MIIMPENASGKLLAAVLAAAGAGSLSADMELQIPRLMAESLNIDKVSIIGADPDTLGSNELYGYVSNTKKPYVDNQLSEYSSFPQLINYRGRGFKSCAVIPMVVFGRVISMVELLSSLENRFTEEMMASAQAVSYVAMLALAYKSESERSMRVAGYFDGAFNSGQVMQLLISQDGRIARMNERAKSDLPVMGDSITLLIGMDFQKLKSLPKQGAVIQASGQYGHRVYRISSRQVNDKMLALSILDITEPARLSLITESMDSESGTGVLFLDEELKVVSATESIGKMIGYDRNLLAGKGIVELTVDRKRGEVKEMLNSWNSGRLHGEIDLATFNGIPAHMRFVLSRSPSGYLMLLSDATMEAYSESIRGAFADFINSTSDIVFTMDELGRIKDCNLPAEAVLGYPRNELVGRELRAFYSDQLAFDRDITYVRNGQKIDNSYTSLIAKSGSGVDAIHSIRLLSGSGSRDYIIVIKELDTKRQTAYLKDQLAREQNRVEKLESTGNLKSQFIYNISHELKTPLTNIKGFSRMMYSGEFGELNMDQLNYLGTIIEETDRLLQIIQQVLDAAKLESQKMRLELREVDLRELCNNQGIRSVEESAKNKGLEFSWTADYDLPIVMADQNRLVQAFFNLIGNAVKFTEKGSIRVRITKKSKKTIQCEISDTGIGISDEDRKKLFKNFYEAPKRELVKQEGSGTGLGLSITRQIIKLHGGRITCESELGKGSRFIFTLPVRPKSKRSA